MERCIKVVLKELVKLNEKIINQEYSILPMNIEKAGYISSIIKKILNEKKIDKKKIRRILIATYEAEINVVIHSYGGVCKLYCDDDELKIVFEDTGPGIPNINEAMKEGFSTACIIARNNGFGAGMGLPNIRSSADYFNLTSNPSGTTLVVQFNLKTR